LKEEGIPAITGVDTRMITKCIREHGSLLGHMNCTGLEEEKFEYTDPNSTNLVAQVSTKSVTVYRPSECCVLIVVLKTTLFDI